MDHDVVVVGAGPSGLLLAAELARLGVDVAVLERRKSSGPRPGAAGSRAIGVHGATLAALEPSGATDRILSEAARITRGSARADGRTLGSVRLDRLGGRFPFVASVPQAATEAAVRAGAPEPLHGAEVVSLAAFPGGASVRLRRGSGEVELRARAVVVAGGAAGRALVLPLFGGAARSYPDRYLMTDLGPLASAAGGARARSHGDPSTAVITLDRGGVVESFPLPGGGRRLVAWDGRDIGRRGDDDEDRVERLRRAVAERAREPGLAALIDTATPFGIRRVLLRRMRRGPIFAIGDTAHEISPIGGQGMNLGLLDAAGLAPALAGRLRSPEHSEAMHRWESDRLASARTAARIAGLNTLLGRSRSPAAHTALAAAVGAALATRLRGLAARAYTMGFDRF